MYRVEYKLQRISEPVIVAYLVQAIPRKNKYIPT